MGPIPKPPARPPDEVPQPRPAPPPSVPPPLPPFGPGRTADAGTWTEIAVEIGGTFREGAYRVERDRVVVRGARGTRSERLGVMPAAVSWRRRCCASWSRKG